MRLYGVSPRSVWRSSTLPVADKRPGSLCNVNGTSIVDSCPATPTVTAAVIAPGFAASCAAETRRLLMVIDGNSAASSTAAPSMFCSVPERASSGTAAAKSAPSSARACASSTTKPAAGTLSQNAGGSGASATLTAPRIVRLTMTWLCPKCASGPARNTRMRSSD